MVVLNKVYPRVRGGSVFPSLLEAGIQGLSPRARGKLLRKAPIMPLLGSIPACAGEAVNRHKRELIMKVYPRVRGGSFFPRYHGQNNTGLSPRARGKPKIPRIGRCR